MVMGGFERLKVSTATWVGWVEQTVCCWLGCWVGMVALLGWRGALAWLGVWGCSLLVGWWFLLLVAPPTVGS